MHVTCPYCETQFTPEAGLCPACGDFRPPLAWTVDFETNRAELALSAGESAFLVRERLVDKGFCDVDADDIVAFARRKVRRTNRRVGRYRLVTGLALLVLGGLLWVATAGHFVFYGLVAVGLAMLLGGVIQWASGANL